MYKLLLCQLIANPMIGHRLCRTKLVWMQSCSLKISTNYVDACKFYGNRSIVHVIICVYLLLRQHISFYVNRLPGLNQCFQQRVLVPIIHHSFPRGCESTRSHTTPPIQPPIYTSNKYSKTSLTDHLYRSTTPLYQSLYFSPKRSIVMIL